VHEKVVQFPLYATTEFGAMNPSEWEEVIDIDFQDSAALLHHPDLKAKHIPEIIKLFGVLISFEPGKVFKFPGWT
jgi:hypothetical protein